jgi:hypothetical protein
MYSIVIPRYMIEALAWGRGDEIELVPRDGTITLVKRAEGDHSDVNHNRNHM